MNRLFPKLSLVNILLLLAYLFLDYYEWSAILSLPLVSAVNWTPVWVQIWFGGTVPVILDGIVKFYHWSFFVLLAIVGFNLVFYWKMEREKEAEKG